jgi:predicted nucleotidyltransferase
MKEAEANPARTATRLLDVPPIPQTRAEAKRVRDELDTLLTDQLGKYASEDTSLVVFGSLARGEWTSGSDLDWTYLIDGQANSDHLRIAQRISKVVRDGYTGPVRLEHLAILPLVMNSFTKLAVSTIRTGTLLNGFCYYSNRRRLELALKPMTA